MESLEVLEKQRRAIEDHNHQANVKKYVAKLKKINASDENRGAEYTHVDADRILCELLRKLGYSDVVDVWKDVPKWYS